LPFILCLPSEVRNLFQTERKAIEQDPRMGEVGDGTPSHSIKIGPGPHSTLFYDKGRAKIGYLDADDLRYVNALEW
jgi:hypothetical protein